MWDPLRLLKHRRLSQFLKQPLDKSGHWMQKCTFSLIKGEAVEKYFLQLAVLSQGGRILTELPIYVILSHLRQLNYAIPYVPSAFWHRLS